MSRTAPSSPKHSRPARTPTAKPKDPSAKGSSKPANKVGSVKPAARPKAPAPYENAARHVGPPPKVSNKLRRNFRPKR